MTLPLIIQIQQATLDSSRPVSDALRQAKLACSKLNLEEFGRWIEHELHGYDDIAFDKLPSYRKLVGLPQGYNPYHGWQTIRFASSEQQTNWGSAPIGMTISAIEETLKDAKSSGTLGFPYPAEVEQELRKSLNFGGFPLRITLSVAQAADIVHAVRNILLQWTIDMEKQGILGENLMFTPTDREKSAVVTDQTITNISIGQVGAFAVHAEHSTVSGNVATTTHMAQDVHNLVQQLEPLLPVAGLPVEIRNATGAALDELKQAAGEHVPDNSRLRRGLDALKRVLSPAGETIIKIAVDAAV